MLSFLRAGGTAAGLMCMAALLAGAPRLAASDAEADLVVAGAVAADAAVKAVQHPTSGIVAEIRRRDGDRVKSGEVLARLDDTATRTNLDLASRSLDQLMVRKARLEAERDRKDDIAFPPALALRAADDAVSAAMAEERAVFAARRGARRSEEELLGLRIRLIEQEIAGLRVQEKAKADEVRFITQELGGVRQLRDQSLAPVTRLTALERDAVRLDGERRGALPVAIAQAESRIADTRLQLIRVARDELRDIGFELRDTDEKLADVRRRAATFEDELKRAQIYAPQDGVIVSSALSSVGRPVLPGEELMLIAPADERPAIEARVDLSSATRLRVGQTARLMLGPAGIAAAELPGRLDMISPVAADAAGLAPREVTLRFVLAPEAPADRAHLRPGTAVRISIAAPETRRALIDLRHLVGQPLEQIQAALL